MKKSILTEDMEHCYLCGREREAVHHIYHGTALRKISDRHGFIVPLCANCHTMSTTSVHLDKKHVKDTALKKLCQNRFERDHSREEFMKIVGRNYLD